MLHKDYTTTILGLKEVLVESVQDFSDKLIVNIKLPRTIHYCPNCSTVTNKIHVIIYLKLLL